MTGEVEEGTPAGCVWSTLGQRSLPGGCSPEASTVGLCVRELLRAAATWGFLIAASLSYLWLADMGHCFLESSKQAGCEWLQFSAYVGYV